MSTLFSSRAGVWIYGDGVACRANWPLGSIELDAQSLTLGALLKSYRLLFSDIDSIRFGWLTTQIIHHAPDVPSLVRISGFGLSRRLRDAIDQHKLQIQIKT